MRNKALPLLAGLLALGAAACKRDIAPGERIGDYNVGGLTMHGIGGGPRGHLDRYRAGIAHPSVDLTDDKIDGVTVAGAHLHRPEQLYRGAVGQAGLPAGYSPLVRVDNPTYGASAELPRRDGPSSQLQGAGSGILENAGAGPASAVVR